MLYPFSLLRILGVFVYATGLAHINKGADFSENIQNQSGLHSESEGSSLSFFVPFIAMCLYINTTSQRDPYEQVVTLYPFSLLRILGVFVYTI